VRQLQAWRWRLATGLVVLLVAIYCWQFVLPVFGTTPPRADDFQDYWQAAVQIRTGGDPYTDFYRTHVPWDWTLSSGYLYPPAFAASLAPLTVLPNALVVRAWLLLMLALMVGSLAMVYRVLGPPRLAELLCLAVIMVTFFPVTATLLTGAMNPVLLLLLTLTWAAWLRRRDTISGVALGAAIAIKLVPIALFPYLLFRRQARLLVAATAVTAVGIGLGLIVTSPEHTVFYFRDMLPHLSAGSGYRENESLSGLASRLCAPSTANTGGNGGWCGRLVAWPAVAVVVGLVIIAVRPRPRNGLEFGLAVAALPLISSLTWSFHLVVLLLPIALLVRHHFQEAPLPRWRVRLLLLAWACFSVLPGIHYLLVVRPLPAGLAGAIATRVVAESYLLGMVLLFAVIWRTVRDPIRARARVEAVAERAA
jgi:hypothetical protein